MFAIRRTALVLAIAAAIAIAPQRSYSAEFEELLSNSEIPLTLQLQDLDSSWRLISISGQFEMGDLMQTYGSLFGGQDPSRGVYYTKGETVEVATETYTIAYRIPPSGEPVNFASALGNVFGLGNCIDGGSQALSPDTTLALSLLNLRTIGSINNIQPFDLQQILAESREREQTAQEACVELQGEQTNAYVGSDLSMLMDALRSYTDEHEGTIPTLNSPEAIQDTLGQWVGSPEGFVHPVTSEPYQFNTALSGKTLDEIENPGETIAFYEATPAADGTRGVVYLDNSFSRVEAAAWERMKPALGLL
ncbi:MAG: hypothetical protein SW833_11395 [Cyanobacteriota bacterium]|nr:hypothetical protein [Cyanobacteriota bacterium]